MLAADISRIPRGYNLLPLQGAMESLQEPGIEALSRETRRCRRLAVESRLEKEAQT